MVHKHKEAVVTVGAGGSRPQCSKESKSMVPTTKEKECQFPGHLYRMLEVTESLGLSHAISWSSDGRSFQVKDSDSFMELVVPQFFKATKYRSFQRQLNLWGFSRIESSSNSKGEGDAVAASWYHESFIRGHPEHIAKMTRTRTKGMRKRHPQLPDRRRNEADSHHLMQELMRYSAEVVRRTSEDEQIDDAHSDNSDSVNILRGSTSDQAFLVASSHKDAMIDEAICNIFSESPPNNGQGIDCVPLALEPLPATSAGILEGNRSSCDLAEFGQLLDLLM